MMRLLGDEVYVYHYKMAMKAKENKMSELYNEFVWHQDYVRHLVLRPGSVRAAPDLASRTQGYWYNSGALYPDFASCFVAVDECTRENGCLEVMKGSHKLGRLNHGSVRGQHGAEPERVQLVEKAGLERVHCVLPRGGAVFFHCNTLHSSAPNHSDSPRWGLICCYNTRGNGKLRGTQNHPSYESELSIHTTRTQLSVVCTVWSRASALSFVVCALSCALSGLCSVVGELEIWDDERVLELGQRQWAALSGTPSL